MLSGLSPKPELQSFFGDGSSDSTGRSLFKTIPPERVGLNGEYDHEGLAKRVRLAFCESFESEEIACLRIQQRGTVIILSGKLGSDRLLHQLVHAASGVYGTTDVEFHGVEILQSQSA